jgi:hypothetical protein
LAKERELVDIKIHQKLKALTDGHQSNKPHRGSGKLVRFGSIKTITTE